MNRLTSQQRKLAYLAGIVVLLIPIIWLGMPATGERDQAGRDTSGGHLAQLRQDYDLGESTLGAVDPSSATMNLVLLGLRGVATNLLWSDLDKQKETKNFAQMRATTESIILLQPHFLQVWRYHGWNLAYNVSAEWDDVKDRYYWVKEGAKFFMKGSKRNQKMPELYWDTGRVLGQKVGRADEWRFFRKFFRDDPSPEIDGPDPAINAHGKDNYLASKDWYQLANDVEDGTIDGKKHVQHIMMRALFRSYPARSQLDYADALHREGSFDEVAQVAWGVAFDDWTKKFGRERFQTPECEVFLEVTNADVDQLAQENGVDRKIVENWVSRTQNVVNYRYWRTLAKAESETQTAEAHREIYNGEQLFKRGELEGALKSLNSGMEKFAGVLSRYETLQHEDLTIEEALWAVLLWKNVHLLAGRPEPADFPLKALVEKEAGRLPEIQDRFNRTFGGL